jgi:HK97 family phage prohead protease
MLHKTVEAATEVTTDLGRFTAVAAVFGNVDRDGDRIIKGAFRDTIQAWQRTGRRVPLHWNHSPDPGDIVGSVEPSSMVETDQGLVVAGQLDLDDNERARKAWRAAKTGSIGLSFGYLVTKSRKGSDGANELVAVDLFEISMTPAPANPQTRILEMKSIELADREKPVPTVAELRRESDRIRFELAIAGIDREAIKATLDRQPTAPTIDELREQAAALGIPGPLRSKAERIRARAREQMWSLLTFTDGG